MRKKRAKKREKSPRGPVVILGYFLSVNFRQETRCHPIFRFDQAIQFHAIAPSIFVFFFFFFIFFKQVTSPNIRSYWWCNKYNARPRERERERERDKCLAPPLSRVCLLHLLRVSYLPVYYSWRGSNVLAQVGKRRPCEIG